MRDRCLFTLLVLGSLASVVGCANLAGISARATGCPKKEVVISDKHMRLNHTTWTATCHGVPIRAKARTTS